MIGTMLTGKPSSSPFGTVVEPQLALFQTAVPLQLLELKKKKKKKKKKKNRNGMLLIELSSRTIDAQTIDM
jgi:hypothetical protein